MGWRVEAFMKGVLIAICILIAVFSVSIGKSSFENVVGGYAPFIITVFVLFILWLGFANLLSVDFEKRRDDHND